MITTIYLCLTLDWECYMLIGRLMIVLFCGFVGGLLLSLTKNVLHSLFASSTVSHLKTLATDSYGSTYFFCLDLLIGVWIVWIFSLLKQYPFQQRWLITALACWSLKLLQSGHWVGLGLVPDSHLIILIIISIISSFLATLLSCKLYTTLLSTTRLYTR